MEIKYSRPVTTETETDSFDRKTWKEACVSSNADESIPMPSAMEESLRAIQPRHAIAGNGTDIPGSVEKSVNTSAQISRTADDIHSPDEAGSMTVSTFLPCQTKTTKSSHDNLVSGNSRNCYFTASISGNSSTDSSGNSTKLCKRVEELERSMQELTLLYQNLKNERLKESSQFQDEKGGGSRWRLPTSGRLSPQGSELILDSALSSLKVHELSPLPPGRRRADSSAIREMVRSEMGFNLKYELEELGFVLPQRNRQGTGESTSGKRTLSPTTLKSNRLSDLSLSSRHPPESPEASARRRKRPPKTMSMVLLDIQPGERREPAMIAFTEDLDADHEIDGDFITVDGKESRPLPPLEFDQSINSIGSISIESKGSCISASMGTVATSSSFRSAHASIGSEPPNRQGRPLSSSINTRSHSPNHLLEYQNYTPTHLEALRLRRESGKGRAFSYESLSQMASMARISKDIDQTGKKKSMTLSTITSPIINPPRSTRCATKPCQKPDVASHRVKISDELSITSSTRNNTPMIVGATSKTSAQTSQLLPFFSSAPIATPPETLISKQYDGLVLTNSSKDEMCNSSTVGISQTPTAAISNTFSCETIASDTSTPVKSGVAGASAEGRAGDKFSCVSGMKSEKEKKSSSTPLSSSQGTVKNQQSMLEYVKDDLLNIDSRHQDGSGSEDIDANMEEFLRIPHKFEQLMVFSLAICVDSFLYMWTMLPLKVFWGIICLICTLLRPNKGIGGLRFHRRHLYAILQIFFVWFVYEKVLCPISIGKLYHWIRGQAMLKLYVLIAIVEVFDRLLCSFGQDAWDSLYWNTTRRPRHKRMIVSIIVVAVYVTVHSLFLFVHITTLSVAVNSADNALMTMLISGNFAEIKSTVFKKYNKQNLFKITTSDICERFKLALFLSLIILLNCFQGEISQSMVFDYYFMCSIVLIAELFSDWIKHSFITKFNFINSSAYFDYALILSGDVTGIGHEGLNLDNTHAAVKRLGLAQIPLVCVTARYLHEAVRFVIAFRGNGDVDHPMSALAELLTDGNKIAFYVGLLGCFVLLVACKIILGCAIRFFAARNLSPSNSSINQIPAKGSEDDKEAEDTCIERNGVKKTQ